MSPTGSTAQGIASALGDELSGEEQEKRAAYICYLSAAGLADDELLALAVPVALGRPVPRTNRGYAAALDRRLIEEDGSWHELARAGIAAAAKERVDAAMLAQTAGST